MTDRKFRVQSSLFRSLWLETAAATAKRDQYVCDRFAVGRNGNGRMRTFYVNMETETHMSSPDVKEETLKASILICFTNNVLQFHFKFQVVCICAYTIVKRLEWIFLASGPRLSEHIVWSQLCFRFSGKRRSTMLPSASFWLEAEEEEEEAPVADLILGKRRMDFLLWQWLVCGRQSS
jgi:hypothetical protein